MGQPEQVPILKCTICGKQVDFLTAQIDRYGKTVHGECYAFCYPPLYDAEFYS